MHLHSRQIPLLLLLLAAFSTNVAWGTALPSLTVKGSSYDVGFAIGSTFSQMYQNFVAEYSSMKTLRDFAATPQGKSDIDSFTSTNKALYPEFYEEMQGIADGSGVAYSDVLLLNYREEIKLILRETQRTVDLPRSCSDVLVANRSIGHNEDNDKSIGKYAALVTFTVTGEPTVTAYVYPLAVPGNAFAWNAAGMVFTVNALFPRNVLLGGRVRQFITRDMLRARSLDDALARIAHLPNSATGCSINLAQMPLTYTSSGATTRLANVEVAPGNVSSTAYVPSNAHLYHFNQYLRLNVSRHADPSSDGRLARALQLPSPSPTSSIASVTRILGDTQGSYKLYARGDCAVPDTDRYTLATALFDFHARSVSIYVQSNPATSDPLIRLPLIS